MARDLLGQIPSVNFDNLAMEYFRGQQLEDAVNCLQKVTSLRSLKDDNLDTPFSDICSDHPQMKLDLFCKQCRLDVCRECTATRHRRHECTSSSDKIHEETRRLGETADSVVELLEGMKRAISGVKEMKQRVREKKDNNINVTREVFATLRKAIDEREEQIITDIKEEAYKREKALELQLERLFLIWTQLKNCLQLMKNTNQRKMRAEEVTKRRMILEQRRGHLKEMRNKSILEPVMSEQVEPEFEDIEQLCQAVNKLGYIPLDPNKCEVVIPPMIVKKMTTLMIIIKNKNNNPATDDGEKLNVSIKVISSGEAIQVLPIRKLGSGRYEASFTANRTLVDRDYKKIAEQDCMVVRRKFGNLGDVATAPTGEVIIVDTSNKWVMVLDNKLNFLKLIGQGFGDSRLVDPDGVAVKDNIIAVSDFGSHQIRKYSLQGELLSVIGSHGDKNGEFHDPRGLAFNTNKLLYVMDCGNSRVQVFQEDDAFAFSFAMASMGNRIAIDPNNTVLVTDCDANCIYLLTHNGEFIKSININSPFAITISPTGYLITGHHEGDYKIRIWSPTYQLVNRFGKNGSKEGEYYDITGMAVDSSGAIYVAEGLNERLQIYQ